jgi:hypothetical protein
MKLWVIKQTENNSYDTYDSAVVAAETEDEAKRVKVGDNYSWCSPEHVTAEYIGEDRGRECDRHEDLPLPLQAPDVREAQ